MSYSSLPVAPGVPATLPAALAALNMFSYADPATGKQSILTRPLYQALTGVQAEPYDTSRPTQNWWDDSPVKGPYFQVVVANGTASIQPLSVANPAKPNLPGPCQYPAWANLPATTPAVQTFGGGPQSEPVLVSNICSLQDAEAVAARFPTFGQIAEDPNSFSIAWNGETRRVWTVNGYNAAILRAQMTTIHVNQDGSYQSGGDGSPGSFNPSNGMWQAAPDPGLSAGPADPIPCAPTLWPGTAFGAGILGAIQIVSSAPQPSGGGGGLTPAQAAQLNAIQATVNEIAAKLIATFGPMSS